MIYGCFSALILLSLEGIGPGEFNVFLTILAKLVGGADGRDFESVSRLQVRREATAVQWEKSGKLVSERVGIEDTEREGLVHGREAEWLKVFTIPVATDVRGIL